MFKHLDVMLFVLAVVFIFSLFTWGMVETYKEWQGQKTKGLNSSQEYFIPPSSNQQEDSHG